MEFLAVLVQENIRWGKKDAADEEVLEESKIAQADEFISKLPEGYNTQVSPGGLNFSGGQKQCLTIACADGFSKGKHRDDG